MTIRYAVSIVPRLLQVAQTSALRVLEGSPKVISPLGLNVYKNPTDRKAQGVCQVWHGTTIDKVPRTGSLLRGITCGPKSIPFLPTGVDFPYGANIVASLSNRNQDDDVLVHIAADDEPEYSQMLGMHILPKETNITVIAVYKLSDQWLNRGKNKAEN